MTALLFSAREGCVECAKVLVENGAQLDLADPEAVSPLILAVFNARFDVARYLIEKGANVNHWDWLGRTALYLAVDYDTLPHMGSVDADTRGYYHTPDVQDRAIASLDLLLSHGGAVNGRVGRLAQAPLHGAAFWGWDRVVEYLLGKGAEINLPDSRGYTAVDYAMGRAAGNSRGGQRVDICKETADFIIAKGGVAGKVQPAAPPRAAASGR